MSASPQSTRCEIYDPDFERDFAEHQRHRGLSKICHIDARGIRARILSEFNFVLTKEPVAHPAVRPMSGDRSLET